MTGLTFVSVSAAPQGDDAKKGDAPKLPLAKPEDQRPLALIRTRALSTERLKRIMLAIHEYESVHTHFPSDICDANGKPLLSWRVAILPYLEQQALYQQFRLNEPWDSEHNKQFATVRVLQFNNSIEPRDEFAVTHFVRPTGAGTMHEPANFKQKLGIRSITDGVSNTLCVLEAEKAVIWSKPDDLAWDAKKPFDVRGAFANVIHLAMGDGSVRTLDGNLPAALATKLFSRGGGEITKDKEMVGTGWNADRDLSKERAERFKAIQQTEREELTKELEQKSKQLSELLQANLKKQEELLKSNLKRLSDPKSATVMIAHELLELNERLREQHLLKQRLNPEPVPVPKLPPMKQE